MNGQEKGGKALRTTREPPLGRVSAYSIGIQCYKVKAPDRGLHAGNVSCAPAPSSPDTQAEDLSTRPAGAARRPTLVRIGIRRVVLATERREIIVIPVSAHLGTPPDHAFPKLQRKDGSERRHTHAILVFDEPVSGPVLIGAGRFRGYGVCRPMEAS